MSLNMNVTKKYHSYEALDNRCPLCVYANMDTHLELVVD